MAYFVLTSTQIFILNEDAKSTQKHWCLYSWIFPSRKGRLLASNCWLETSLFLHCHLSQEDVETNTDNYSVNDSFKKFLYSLYPLILPIMWCSTIATEEELRIVVHLLWNNILCSVWLNEHVSNYSTKTNKNAVNH